MVLSLVKIRPPSFSVPPLWTLLRTGLLVATLSLIGDELGKVSWSHGGNTILWPTNGFLLGVLLSNPKRFWPSYMALGFLVDVALNIFRDNAAPLLAIVLSMCNALEVALPAFLLYSVVAPQPDLTRRRQFLPFLGYAVVMAPAICAFVAAYAAAWGGVQAGPGLPTPHDFLYWFAGDALGMAIVTPLYLAFQTNSLFRDRSTLEVMVLFTVLSGATYGIFWQTRYPLLYLELIVLLILGVRLGMAGSALGLLLLSFAGGFCTLAGHGPLTLNPSVKAWERNLLFQSFIITSMLLLYITEVITSESQRLRVSLESSESRFRLLAEAASDVIMLLDLEGKCRYLSPAVSEVLGFETAQLLGTNLRQLVSFEDLPELETMFRRCHDGIRSRSVELRCRNASQNYLWLEMKTRSYTHPVSGVPAGFVAVARDISPRKAEEEARQQAFDLVDRLSKSDPLTGVANRRHFDHTLEAEWLRAARESNPVSLLMLDVDYFKRYNDVYGHIKGDECLRRIALTIQANMRRPADLLARYGGEEFVVLLPNTDAAGANTLADAIRRSVFECRIPHAGNAASQVISVSVGAATVSPHQNMSQLDLLDLADQALYRAKSLGRNCVQAA
jgi:diguanylate cyclase (GGDEF)-like protein/PAS domain S-box-containing protein